MSLYWLSFANPSALPGQKFLGACIVEAADLKAAVNVSVEQHCNPGGEIDGVLIPPHIEPHVGVQWKNRLLSKEECDKFDQAMLAARNRASRA